MFKNGKPARNFPAMYDAHIDKTIPYYHSINQEIINLVKATGREPIIWLDTGCGTGTLAIKAMKAFPNTRFLLSDPSQEMLVVARDKLDADCRHRCTLLEAAATQDLKLPGDEQPDVISAILCHHYLNKEGRKAATARCFELLAKGGLYITFENICPFSVSGIELGKSNWRNFQLAAGKTVSDVDNHLKRFGTEYFPITVDQHILLLRDCGFSAVEILWYSYLQAGFYCIK